MPIQIKNKTTGGIFTASDADWNAGNVYDSKYWEAVTPPATAPTPTPTPTPSPEPVPTPTIYKDSTGKSIDPAKFTNLTGSDLENWAASQGFKPISSSQPAVTETNARLLGPTEFNNLKAGWKKEGLTMAEIEQHFLSRDGGKIYLKNNAPTSQSIIAGREKTVGSLPKVTPSTDLLLGSITAPDLPEVPDPRLGMQNFTTGLAGDLASKKAELMATYQKQLDEAQRRIDTLNAEVKQWQDKQQQVLDGKNELSMPWRAQLEREERKRLKIEENYFAQQKSISELETLLNAATEDIKAAEGVTGLSSIRLPRIAELKENYQGRVGVIQAVMAARTDQIDLGLKLIDRTADAIIVDRKARLDYYDALFKFYSDMAGTKAGELVKITEEKKTALENKISLQVAEINNLQKSADYIKDMMLDPDKAKIVERAGISLTDSVEQINQKLSKYSLIKETRDIKNKLSKEGFKYIPTMAELNRLQKNKNNSFTEYIDSAGVKHYFLNPAKKATGPTDKYSLSRQSVKADMDTIKGSDGYVDTAKYAQIRNNIAINEPNILSWFDSTYPAKIVLNPNDPTAKKYFATAGQMIKNEGEIDFSALDKK